MKPFEKINFRVFRDVGQIYNTSFKYMRQNRIVLFKSITYYVMPFILVGAFVFFNGIFDFITIFDKGTEGNWLAIGMAILQDVLGLLLIWISYTIYTALVYEHMLMYHESPNPETITHQQIWKATRKRFFPNLLNTFVQFIASIFIMWAASFIIGIVSMILLAISAFLGAIGISIMTFIIVVLAFFAFFYLSTNISPMIFVSIFHRVDIFTAFARCFSIVHRKYNFWKALGAFFLLVVILSVLHTNLVTLPIGIVMGIIEYNGIDAEGILATDSIGFAILFRVIFPVFSLLYYYTLSIFFITQGFTMLSLDEPVGGKGLMEKITKMGTYKDVGTEYYDVMY